MDNFIGDILVPVGTFLAGVFVEHFRQAKARKREYIKNITDLSDELVAALADERKIYELKYKYNKFKNLVNEFCRVYSLDNSYFFNELIDVNIYLSERKNPDKVAENLTSLITKISSF